MYPPGFLGLLCRTETWGFATCLLGMGVLPDSGPKRQHVENVLLGSTTMDCA